MCGKINPENKQYDSSIQCDITVYLLALKYY